MKKLITISFLFFLQTTFAGNYYFSNTGNDAAAGTSTGTAWQTLNKFNTTTFSPGDNIYFNRGDVFYGQITISQSGTSGNPITLGAYGTGANPVITGFANITAWTNLGSNIWESTSAVSLLSTCNMVVINGVNTAMGRTPNTGSYYHFQSHTGTGGNITSSDLTGTPNWAGAELALNISTYTIGRNPITSQSGGTLNYTRAAIDEDIQSNNQRFIIQNDPRTLDAANEWYYNPSTKKIRIYNTVSPTNVQVASIDTLVKLLDNSYITFDGISFEGSSGNLICLGNASNVTIQNCSFDYAGRDGIFCPFRNVSNNMIVYNNSFDNCNNNSIDISGSAHSPHIYQNTVSNSGSIFGMGGNGAAVDGTSENGLGSYSGILAGGTGSLVELNSVNNTALNGIRYYGSNSTVQKNYITNSCAFLTDGAAIYTDNDATIATGEKIIDNIIVGSGDNGIYCDAQSNHIEVARNSISGCVRTGLFINNDQDINVHNNSVFDCAYGLWFDNLAYAADSIYIYSNSFIAKTLTQKTALYNLTGTTVPTALHCDSNYYSRPIGDTHSMYLYLSSTYTDISLSDWQSTSGQDAHSNVSPITIANDSLLKFYNNPTDHDSTVTVVTGVDMMNTSYSGNTVIPAYSSLMLIETGAQPPQGVIIITRGKQIYLKQKK